MVAAAQETGLVREEFGATSVQQNGQTAESAVAAQMQAQVNARYIMALRRPRSWLQVRAKILDECKRPRFAEAAVYAKPVGGDKVATGLSIRFAEAAVRYITNTAQDITTLYDDPRKRLMRIQVADLESNLTYAQDIVIEKTKETRFLRKNQKGLSSRTNSFGHIVHLVEATEGDLDTKQGAAVSKVLRNLILRLLPGDIQDDARDAIEETMRNVDSKDPQMAIKKIVDGFAKLRVMPDDIAEYLGHDVAKASPAQVQSLRVLYAAVQQGEITWVEVMESKKAPQPEDENGEAAAPSKPSSRSQNLAEKLKAKGKAAAPEQAEQPTEPVVEPEDSDDYHQRAARMAAKG